MPDMQTTLASDARAELSSLRKERARAEAGAGAGAEAGPGAGIGMGTGTGTGMAAARSYRVVVADSRQLYREALCRYLTLAGHEFLVAQVSGYDELLKGLRHARADIVLIDADLRGLPSSGCDMDLQTVCPDVRIGVMTMEPPEKSWPDDFAPHGLFPKNMCAKAILDGIRQVLRGEIFSGTPSLWADMQEAGESHTHGRSPDDFRLTERERQVLSFLVKGASNKEVARALDLQVVTVKLHVRGICRKLGAQNRTQAALMAQGFGWG